MSDLTEHLKVVEFMAAEMVKEKPGMAENLARSFAVFLFVLGNEWRYVTDNEEELTQFFFLKGSEAIEMLRHLGDLVKAGASHEEALKIFYSGVLN